MFILAAIPWPAIGVIFTASVSLLSAILVFVNSRSSGKALESSTMVQTAFEGQKNLVDALQEEITRYAAVSKEQTQATFKCRQECDELKSKVARTESELHEARSEIRVLKKRLQEAGISI